MIPLHVLIVGAGPAGMALALGLSNWCSCKVDLLEKQSSFDVQGSSLYLAPNGIKALNELICQGPKNEDKNYDVSTLTDLGVQLPTGVDTPASALCYWNLRDWLLEKVEEDDNIALHQGVKVLSIQDEDEDDQVTVHCDGCDYSGDLVVGADGVNSQVRQLLGLEPNPSSGYRIWRGSADARGEPLLEALLDQGIAPVQQLWGRSTFTVFNHHPKVPNRLNWVIAADDPRMNEPGATPMALAEGHLDDEKVRNILERLFEKSAPHELTQSYVMATSRLPEPDSASGWGGKGRVTIIGDAAHAIRPASGQGSSLAFEDSVVFVRKLKELLAEGELDMKGITRLEWQKILRDFENERLVRVKRISDREQEVAEASHRRDAKPEPPTEEYTKFVYDGV